MPFKVEIYSWVILWNGENEWFDNLSTIEQDAVKRESWRKIFDINPPIDTEWNKIGRYVQATFWEFRLEQVVRVQTLLRSLRSNKI